MNFEAEILTAPHDNSGIWENIFFKKAIKIKCPLSLLSLQTWFNSFEVRDYFKKRKERKRMLN